MITEFHTWHEGDVPDRRGWIVEGWSNDCLTSLHHADSWDEAVKQCASVTGQGELGEYEARLYFMEVQ